MRNRNFWFHKIESIWRRRSAVWLSGIRGSGKTELIQNLPQIEYIDCALPAQRRKLEHPLEFLTSVGEGRVALDNIDRLVNPADFLNIATRFFPNARLIVTSPIPAALAFRDEDLLGRIEDLWLTPLNSADLSDMQQDEQHTDLQKRFLRGGLPKFFSADNLCEQHFQSWMDEYWASDVHELFKIERRASFQTFVEHIFRDSGQVFEATRYAPTCGVSRTTIMNYLNVLSKTYAAHIVRPFNSKRSTEIVAAPRVYGFDTGFVAFHNGWDSLRRSDLDPLWRHFVLNEIHSELQTRHLYYWKDKREHSIDFIFARRIHTPTALECCWASTDFDASGLLSFRKQYPQGENIVVCNDVTQPFLRNWKTVTAKFVPLKQLIEELLASPS